MTRLEIRRLLGESDAPPGQRFVVTVIALHAHADGTAWPSVETIARYTGYSVRQVRRYVGALEERATDLTIPERSRGGRPHRFRVRVPNRVSLSGSHPDTLSGSGPFDTSPEPGQERSSTRTGKVTNPDTDVRGRALKALKEKRKRDAHALSADDGHAPHRTAAKVRERSAPETGWPAGFTLTSDLAAYAAGRGCRDPQLAFDHFHNDAIAKDRRHRHWSAAFRKWLDNHARYGCPCQSVRAADGRWEDLV